MTITKTTWTYEDLVARLAINELDLEKELKEHPVLLQTVAEEAARLGQELARLKTEEKATCSLVLLDIAKGNAANPKAKPTVDEKKAQCDSNQNVINVRNAVAEAEYHYQRWYDLRNSYKARGETLDAFGRLIMSGYIGYRRVAPAST